MTMTAEQRAQLRQLATDAHELGIIKRYTKGIEANKRFVAIATPLTVLAMLDELERKDKRIAELEARTVTVKLPERKGDSDGGSTSEFDYGWNAAAEYRDEQWKTALTKAGINLMVEG